MLEMYSTWLEETMDQSELVTINIIQYYKQRDAHPKRTDTTQEEGVVYSKIMVV